MSRDVVAEVVARYHATLADCEPRLDCDDAYQFLVQLRPRDGACDDFFAGLNAPIQDGK